jgi:hypothetical protein
MLGEILNIDGLITDMDTTPDAAEVSAATARSS